MAKFGLFKWIDLTVDNADEIRDFYCKLLGWTYEEYNMGEYSDYIIKSSDGEGITGICFKKGKNANMPSQWLNYVTVENAEEAVKNCLALGGKVIKNPETVMGSSIFAVIQDPAGAYLGLYQEGVQQEV